MIRISESENNDNYLEVQALGKPNLPAVVVFYRSKLHAKGNYGGKDTDYDGEFGFDSFDKEVVAKGLATNYEKLDGVEKGKPTVGKNHQYLCPFVSIYPPNVVGNINNTKSSITLYVKLEEDKEKGTDDPNFGAIHFQSSDRNSVEIVGTQRNRIAKTEEYSKKIALKLGDKVEPEPITIECVQEFSTPINITARTSTGTLIGQLILVPNDKRFTTTIQPVELHFGPVASKKVDIIPHSSLMKDVERDFNEKSFNQAFINGTLTPDTHKITLTESQFKEFIETRENGKKHLKTESIALEYNDLIENRYSALLVNQAQKNKAEEKVKETGQKMLEVFDKKYKYKKKGIKYAEKAYEANLVTKIWGLPKVQKAYTEYKTARATYDNLDNTDTSLNKKGKIHVFYTTDIYGAYGGTAGYSDTGSGVSHLFKSLLDDETNIASTLHEIAHGLGLKHTFEKDLGASILREKGVVYKQDIEKKIELNNFELKNLINKRNELDKVNDSQFLDGELKRLKELDVYYYQIQRGLSIKEQFNQDINFYERNFVKIILKLISFESSPLNAGSGTIDSLEEIENKIIIREGEKEKLTKELKTGEVVKAKKLANRKEQSGTKENYMDYGFKDSGDGERIPDFKRKSFYKTQWNQMRESIQFLKEIK